MLKERLSLLIQRFLNRIGCQVTRIRCEPNASGPIESLVPYIERDEYGAGNLQTKLERVRAGLPFEFPDIINLNKAVALLLGNGKRIVELGCGTGKFAFAAAQDRSRSVIASEFDQLTYQWCLENMPKQDNLMFLNGPVPQELGPFDVSVSIEVVEHVWDYVGFFREMCLLAPRSLISTPNRKRSAADYHAGPPIYLQHVREWTAGEFYWVLRCFWSEVRLYALTSQTDPHFLKVNVDTNLSPLIADCRSPISRTTI